MSARTEAFWTPPPPAWKPAVGELVYMDYGHASARGRIVAELLSDLFIVEYQFGGIRRKQFSIKSLRPIPKDGK